MDPADAPTPDAGALVEEGPNTPKPALDEVARLVVARLPPPFEFAQRRLAAFLRLTLQWNEKIDLTAAKSEEQLLDLALTDALQVAMLPPTLLPSESPSGALGLAVVDVGSGFGAPGLVLAMLRPDLRVTLVEPLQKRVTFLRSCVGQLSLGSRVTVLKARVENLPDSGKYDLAMSRATFAPERWLSIGRKLAPIVVVFTTAAVTRALGQSRSDEPSQSPIGVEVSGSSGSRAKSQHDGSRAKSRVFRSNSENRPREREVASLAEAKPGCVSDGLLNPSLSIRYQNAFGAERSLLVFDAREQELLASRR